MKTVKEIEARLKLEKELTAWIESLKNDERIGVQKALKRWYKNYEKKIKIHENHMNKLAFDHSFKQTPTSLIAGVDEAGRGPLAGPVVTAAVILPDDCGPLIGLDDSKSLSKDAREHYAKLIKELAIDYAIHIQDAEKIDAMNIFQATKNSMEQAVQSLKAKPHYVIVDAMNLSIAYPTSSIVKADAKSLVVAAASMLAKTTRDDYMEQLGKEFPMYQFHKNAGYGTTEHLLAIERYGPCLHHRKSFEPIKSIINQSVNRK